METIANFKKPNQLCEKSVMRYIWQDEANEKQEGERIHELVFSMYAACDSYRKVLDYK